MKTAIVTLKSASPYSQSRYHNTPKNEQESNEAYEERTWREKGHYDEKDEMFIPPMALKNAIDDGVKFRKRKGPNGGASTWTKNFTSGIMIMDPIPLGVQKDDVGMFGGMMDTQGGKGNAAKSSRVYRMFPEVKEWESKVTVYVLDDAITEGIFEEVLKDTGMFIGIGRFRPQNGGFNGRFSVEKIEWQE